MENAQDDDVELRSFAGRLGISPGSQFRVVHYRPGRIGQNRAFASADQGSRAGTGSVRRRVAQVPLRHCPQHHARTARDNLDHLRPGLPRFQVGRDRLA